MFNCLKQINPLIHLFILISLLGWQPRALAIEKGEVAPDFSIKTIDTNEIVNLSDYRGKIVYLDFWASWCGPCRVSFPFYNQLFIDYKNKDLVILAISEDVTIAEALKFLERVPAKFTTAWDENGAIANKYQPIGMPTSYLIDREGKIDSVITGFKKSKIPMLRQKIDLLLEQ